MHISVSKKILFATILFAAVCVGMIFLAGLPLLADIEKYGARVQEQRGEIAGYGDRVAIAREFDVFAKEEKNNFDKIPAIFVNAKMPLDLIDSLEAAARDSGVEIKLSQSMFSQGNTDWPSISIAADISGDINGVLRFIKKVESSPYLVGAQSVGIDIDAIQKKSVVIPGAATSTEALAQTAPEAKVFPPAQAHILLKAYAKQ